MCKYFAGVVPAELVLSSMSTGDKKFVVVQSGQRITPNLSEADAKAEADKINQRLQESVGQEPSVTRAEVKEVLND